MPKFTRAAKAAGALAVVRGAGELVREVLEHARVASGGGGTGAACTVVGFDFDAAFDEVRATRFRPCYLVLSLRCLCALSSSLSDCGARSSLSRCVVQLSKLAVEVEAQCPVGAQPDEEDDAI